jgi:hypothetical protein
VASATLVTKPKDTYPGFRDQTVPKLGFCSSVALVTTWSGPCGKCTSPHSQHTNAKNQDWDCPKSVQLTLKSARQGVTQTRGTKRTQKKMRRSLKSVDGMYGCDRQGSPCRELITFALATGFRRWRYSHYSEDPRTVQLLHRR